MYVVVKEEVDYAMEMVPVIESDHLYTAQCKLCCLQPPVVSPTAVPGPQLVLPSSGE